MAKSKSKPEVKLADNPFEAVRDIGKGVKRSLQYDVGEQGAKGFLKQLGIDLTSESRSSGEKKSEKLTTTGATEIFNIFTLQSSGHESAPSKKSAEKTSESRAEGAINYSGEVIRNRERASKTEVREMNQTLQQIKVELEQLVDSSKTLKMEFAEVSVEQTPENVGKYHVHFFEWMLQVIRLARQNVEESGAWMDTVKGKGSKKASYWGMFKQHGTSFGLSNERAVATQVG